MIIRHCSLCDQPIPEEEIESGRALVYQNNYYCAECAEYIPPEIKAAAQQQRAKAPGRPGPRKAPGDAAGKGMAMTFEEIVAAAEREGVDRSADEELAGSGFAFDDMAPGTTEFLPQQDMPEKWVRPGAEAEFIFEPVELDPSDSQAGALELEIVGGQPDAAEPEAVDVPPLVETEEPVDVEIEVEEYKPAPPEPQKKAAAAEVVQAEAPPAKAPSAKAPSARARPPSARTRRHVAPERRASALLLQQKRKKPVLAVVVILLIVLGAGGLILYKKYAMPPEDKQKPSSTQVEKRKPKTIEEKRRMEELAEIEQGIKKLEELADKILKEPGEFASFVKKLEEMRFDSLTEELTKRLDSAEKVAKDGFAQAADRAFSKVKTAYDAAITNKNLKSALAALDEFPELFAQTKDATSEIPKLREYVETIITLIEEIRASQQMIEQLIKEERFLDAVELIEKEYRKLETQPPAFLGEVRREIESLRERARALLEQRRREEAQRDLAYKQASENSTALAQEAKFLEAVDLLKSFMKQYPGSLYDGEIMSKVEDLLQKKHHWEIENFFNSKDLSGWTVQGGWSVAGSVLTGESHDSKIWLLKGDPSWSDYKFEFDFRRKKGSLILCLRAAQGEPESGFVLPFSEYPFGENAWFHVTCEVHGERVFVKTSFNEQEFVFTAGRPAGQLGFALEPNSRVEIKNVKIDMP